MPLTSGLAWYEMEMVLFGKAVQTLIEIQTSDMRKPNGIWMYSAMIVHFKVL